MLTHCKRNREQDNAIEIAFRIGNTYPTMADHLNDLTTSSKRANICTQRMSETSQNKKTTYSDIKFSRNSHTYEKLKPI
jgi:hypothetical protein